MSGSNRESKRILVVDDDQELQELLQLHLLERQYLVELASDGQRGLELAQRGNYHLIILDLGLPTLDGIDVCKQLRVDGVTTPIIMLTERGAEVERVLGLELGADDYLAKPFSILELMARVKALLRRNEAVRAQEPSPSEGVFRLGELEIDSEKRQVLKNKSVVQLTSKEFELLLFLAMHPGRPFSREELLLHVWGYETSAYEHTVSSHVNRIRKKIEAEEKSPVYLLTVWGYGYRFVEAHELPDELAA